MKQRIRLTENDLHKIVKEAVKGIMGKRRLSEWSEYDGPYPNDKWWSPDTMNSEWNFARGECNKIDDNTLLNTDMKQLVLHVLEDRMGYDYNNDAEMWQQLYPDIERFLTDRLVRLQNDKFGKRLRRNESMERVVRESVRKTLDEWNSQQAQLDRRTSAMLGDYSARYADIDDRNNERWHRDYQTSDGGFSGKRSTRQSKAFHDNEDPLAMRQQAYNMVGNNKSNPNLAKHIMRNTRGNTPYTSQNPNTPTDKNFDMERMERNKSDRARYNFSRR